jgi:hypothetical protein
MDQKYGFYHRGREQEAEEHKKKNSCAIKMEMK